VRRAYPSAKPAAEPWIALALFGVAAIVFGRTAYPTITWWDSSSYSLAAATLGVASPPGSLLLTLLGWPITRMVAPAQVAHALNVFAATIGAATVAMVFLDAIKVFESARGERPRGSAMAGAAFGALLFSSTTTLWDYAVRFTPYILSVFVTSILLAVMLAWWRRADEPDAWLLLVLLSFLFGLDFSVHRTNALLIPGALAWVLIRKPSAVLDARTIASSFVAVSAGLAIQLLIIPVAASGSPLNFANPNTLSRFWKYVTLEQLGGGFLLKFFPRNSDVWSSQVADVLRILADNFFSVHGAFVILGYVPGFAAALGMIALFRVNARLATAFVALLVIQILATIAYFNIPANYFRSFDRHYLPICVVLALLGAVGFGAAADWATKVSARAIGLAVAAFVGLIPIASIASNYSRHDGSRRFFAHDWAMNALTQLPPNAVYLTVGDNDTFPVMYVQAVEGVRRDVSIINTSIAMLPEWRARLRANDPSFPLSATTTTDSIVRSTTFSRPIALAVTGVAAGMTVPKDSARFEGLHWTIAPALARNVDLVLARRHLFENSKYSGFSDPSVGIDPFTPEMAAQYYYSMSELLAADRAQARGEQCRADRDAFRRLVPPDRISLPRDFRARFESACGP
jgi:hypothetical protein